MKTLKELSLEIVELLKKNPEFGDLPIIYSRDDEGNDYQAVHCTLSPLQVENIQERDLQVVGFLGSKKYDYDTLEELEEKVEIKDINCICIN
jgi:hypothetical protein